MQRRIFHNILVSVLAIMLIAPFFVSYTYADTTGGNFSVTTRVEYIKGEVQNGGYYNWFTNIYTTVNFYVPFTGQFRIRTDSGNAIYTTGRASVDGAVLLSVGTDGLYVDFQCSECTTFTYVQGYDYRTGYSTNIYGEVLNGAYASGTVLQYVDGIETQLSTIQTYIDGVEASLNDIRDLVVYDGMNIYQTQFLNIFLSTDFSKISFLGNLPYFSTDNTATTMRFYNRNKGDLRFIFFSSFGGPVFTINGIAYNVTETIQTSNNLTLCVLDWPDDGATGFKNITLGRTSGTASYRIYPLYWGLVDSTPDDLQLLISGEYDNTYTDLLNDLNYTNSRINLGVNNIYGLLSSGSSSSSSIADSNNELNEDLNDSITEYESFESDFKSDFSTNMTQIQKPGIDNILSAATWYTTQLTALFNASGDFKIMFTLPLVLGLALFFIGRGALAYRESRTDVIESRTYDRELGDGSHYYKTYRQKRWK